MANKKGIYRELIWFFLSAVGGIFLTLIYFRIINVSIGLGEMAAGVIATLLAVYVIRMTLWVFKQGM